MSRRELHDFISESDLEALHRDVAQAEGLPSVAYTSDEFWQLERRSYFSSRWMACAHERDLSQPGDVLPVSIGGYELILTRDEAGTLHAFHNVCSHRAMKVVEEKQTAASRLSCPWHCWTYDLCGRLVATPNIGGMRVSALDQFDRQTLGLRQVRCDAFLNLVFVNLDGQAPPLSEFLAPITDRLAAYDLKSLEVSDQSTEAVFRCNWKLAMEGGLEDYHLPWVHPQFGTHTGEFQPEWDNSGCYVGFSNRWPIPNDSEGSNGNHRKPGTGLPKFPHIVANPPTDGLSPENLFLMIPPSAVIAVMSDHVVATLLIPDSVAQTTQRRSFLYLGDAATAQGSKRAREAVASGWVSVGAQDMDLAATLQRQHRLRDDINMPTRFSPHWEPAVHQLQKMVIDELRSSRNTDL